MQNFEKECILVYLHNLLATHGHNAGVTLGICEYLEANRKLLDHHHQDLDQLLVREELADRKNLSRPAIQSLRQAIADLLVARRTELQECEPSQLHRNLELLGEHLGLDDIERQLIGLSVRHRCYGVFNSFLNEVTREHLNTVEACAACLDLDVDLLAEHLCHQSRLLTTGILQQPGRAGSDIDDHFQVIDQVFNALQRTRGSLDDMLTAILGHPTVPALGWDDFDHLGPVRERLGAFLRRVAGERGHGVNILLWGAPGTGKTEFCKTMAAHLGCQLHAIGEKDDEGGEPTRRERLASYRLALNLLRFRRDALLMFDEMDDLFEGNALARLLGSKSSAGSKVFMNRLLEDNPVPTLWLINDPSLLDEAFLRRMSLVIEIKVPPSSQRERVWKRLLDKNAITLPAETVRDLATLNLPPALIDSAARYARQADGGAEDFRFAAEGILQVIRGRRISPQVSREQFLPELTPASLDLEALAECLCNAPGRKVSLCLYGPPGTGKSAYLRYLAERMGMPVLVKRASDLLDMYVGGSEKRIAKAFQEAIDQEAFLIFDEVDSLLGDRRFAEHGWQISQVNEMLTWMESHPLPFACTTNLKERLDQASLRRFTFKCCFEYLHPMQVEQAFHHFFAMKIPGQGNASLRMLTPGDFAVVRSKAEVLRMLNDGEGLCRLLKEEIDAREEHAAPKIIGFGAVV